MHHDREQIRNIRRTPSVGVSGVTLLMLVTMVLTASPALGRATDLSVADVDRTARIGERATHTPRAEPRVGGRRELAPRQIQPAGGGVALAPERARVCPVVRSGQSAPIREAGPAMASRRVPVWLLNTPPPQR